MPIADFVVLADVLGVPPVALLFPLGTSATVEVLPGREISTRNKPGGVAADKA